MAVLALNRPGKRNALSASLMRALIEALRAAESNPAIRAVIVAAHGKVFSSGHDLGELTGRSISDYRTLFDICVELMQTIQAIPQPVIAEVQGLATAAGCQLVATCDLAVASEEAGFATPGVKIGLFCTTPMVALTRAIGRKRAMEMLLTGRTISAAVAAEWGLVNTVVPASNLRQASFDLANKVAESSPLTTTIGKQAFYAQVDLDQDQAYRYAKEVMSNNALAEDAQEGISAFLQKREACWTGR